MQWSPLTIQLIRAAFDEDMGAAGDVSGSLLANSQPTHARLVARSAGVVSGLALVPEILTQFAARGARGPITFQPAPDARDGAAISAGARIGELHGPCADLLAIERTLLNFVGRLCGVATLTADYVGAARRGAPHVQVLDTRKTLPGWRELDKYAVRCGGGTNHRFGLWDAVLLKDNHLAGLSVHNLPEAVGAWLASLSERRTELKFVEVEVDSLAQFAALVAVPGIDILLLDNFSIDDLRAAVRLRDERGLRGRLLLEASGGITLTTIAQIAQTGVDRVSVGAITHSAPVLDVALDF